MRPRTETPILTSRQRQAVWICLALCLCFLVADRWLILHQFGFRYVDDDQSIMWNGAMEMAHGRFHEPCFYGQGYNSMLEGLVAVPLLWLGVGPDVALPLTTSTLTLFPFILLAAVLVRKREYVLAAFMLVFPVTLSPEFGMITSMPRGFVTGVFLSSFAVLPLFSRRGIFLLISPFFAILALYANPNAALVLVPAGFLILLRYHSERRLYLLGAAGALPAAVLYYLGHHFYEVRPNYVVHGTWNFGFTFADIGWADLRFLDDVSPVVWRKGLFVFVLLAILVVILARGRQWRTAMALLFGMVLMVATFGMVKVHNGLPSVFFPWARMYLAVPFLLALFLAQWKLRPPRWTLWLMPLLAAGFFSFKCFAQAGMVAQQVAPGKEKNMEVVNVADLKQHCLRIDQVARANKVDLVVVNWGLLKHLTNYGCPCLAKDFPVTIEPELDRRTWLLRSTVSEVMPNVLLAGYDEHAFAGVRSVEMVSQDPPLYLVKGNALRTDSLLARLRIELRPH